MSPHGRSTAVHSRGVHSICRRWPTTDIAWLSIEMALGTELLVPYSPPGLHHVRCGTDVGWCALSPDDMEKLIPHEGGQGSLFRQLCRLLGGAIYLLRGGPWIFMVCYTAFGALVLRRFCFEAQGGQGGGFDGVHWRGFSVKAKPSATCRS